MPRPLSWWRRAWTLPAPRLAVAAVTCLLLAGLAGTAIWLRSATPAVAPRGVASAPPVPPAVLPPLAPDTAYEDAVARLRREAESHLRADPQVIEVLDRNLESLTIAIADYRDALARRPHDPRLLDRLEEARRRKLELLQRAATLAAAPLD